MPDSFSKYTTTYLTMPHWPTLLFDNRRGTALTRTQELLAKLGHPEKRLPPVVHVAGTNGKGSTIAFMRAMLEAAGYKVHVYTSPHLHRFNERIVLAGREIDDTQLYSVIEAARIAARDVSYSFFEGTTAAALLAFADTPADIFLMETGMGGRFDPTNALTDKALTVITTISPDHTEYLGESLSQIAWHKAGIMRAEVPCVVSFQPQEVHAVLAQEAEAIGALAYAYGQHWQVERTAQGLRYSDAEGSVDLPAPALLGLHQYVNAGTAIAALSLLEAFAVDGEAIAQGLARVRWPGRMERVTSGDYAAQLPEGFELWMDGGHNMAAGHALAAFLDEHWHDKPTAIIFGTTQGKDVVSLLAPLVPKITGIWAVPVVSEPKSYSPHAIVASMQEVARVTASESVEEAIDAIVQHADSPVRILVFGSLYLRVLVT